MGIPTLDQFCQQSNMLLNPIALRMAKTPKSFGHSERNRVKQIKSQYHRNQEYQTALPYKELFLLQYAL